MKKCSLIILSILFIAACTSAQDVGEFGSLYKIESKNAPFPHKSRIEGHKYSDSLYSFVEHYNDSTVAIFVPNGYNAKKSIDLVFYFHGWNNNIKKSFEKFELAKQFCLSNKNAVLVFPEGPKNAPDSFGGKLEEKNVFSMLVKEVIAYLYDKGITDNNRVGRIILSGHSGAYRVISFILNRGGLRNKISEVYLFDALYGELEKFTYWIDNMNGRFVNILTPNGGTYNNSTKMLSDFDDWNIAYKKYNSENYLEENFGNNRIVFLFSELGHSEVINPYFELLLKTSSLENK